MTITEQQELILNSDSKRIVVLACPGSGKTDVVIQKIIRLIRSGVSLKRILSVTFTRKAAKEMLERIEKEVTVSKAERRNVCTLHSLGCRILYSYRDVAGLKDEYKVALSAEKEIIAKQILPKEAEANEIVKSFLEYVSSIKNGFEINKFNFTMTQFNNYCERMIEANLIDLDDYIYLPVKILSGNDYIRDKVSGLYDYIYVDEYQDINKIQNDFLELLIRNNSGVLYVGDDDQSIYEFRGSSPNYILEKSKEGSGYEVFYLTRNFRSQAPIVELSKKVLTSLDADSRRAKEIVADKTDSCHKPVRNKPFSTKTEEIDYVVNEIYRLVTESCVEPKEIAVLCRYTPRKNRIGIPQHPELQEIETKLHTKGISATMSMSMDGDNETARQIRRLCETLIAFHRDEFIPEFLNLIESNIYVKSKFEQLLQLIDEKYNTGLSSYKSFTDIMNALVELNPKVEPSAFQKRLDRYIRSYTFTKEQYDKVHSGALPSEVTVNIMTYLLENDSAYDKIKDICEYAFSFAKSCEEAYDVDENDEDEYSAIALSMNEFLCEQEKNMNNNSVRLLTAHQSKGLQFDVVFVVGLEAGSFPCNIEKLEGQNLDNERRLFYVCITRARELLYLSSTGLATDEISADLADKSFIYSIPASYFSEENKSFDDIDFTVNDKESLKQLKEKDEIISQLESDYFVTLNKLKESLSRLELVQQKNKDLLNSQISPKEISTLKARIKTMLDSQQQNMDYIVNLEKTIKQFKENEADYRRQIVELDKRACDDTAVKEKDAIQAKWSAEKATREKLESEKERLCQALTSEQEKTKSLEQKLNNATASNEEMRVIIAEVSKEPKNALVNAVQAQNKIDLIYSTLLNIPNEIISAALKSKITHLFKVFVTSKRYPRLAPMFESGLSAYQDMVEATVSFLNGQINKDIFRARLSSSNYKGSLDKFVRIILEACCHYSVHYADYEFKTGIFLNTLINEKNYPFVKYKKLISYYKNERMAKPIPAKLAKDMYTMYAITSTCNHDKTFANEDYSKEYQGVFTDFLDNPSTNYYDVISSFLIFIDMYADDEMLLFQLK